MGQKHWAFVCAIVLAATTTQYLVAQQTGDPFGDGPSTPAPQTSKPVASAPGARSSSYTPDNAEQRIDAALDQPLREPIDFIEQPLRDVMTILAETYDLPIQFDTPALDAVAASPDVEVSINIHNVTLRSALDLMLKNAGEELTYIIDKEVLLITTEEEAATRLEVNVYRVDDLIGDGLTGSPYSADSDTLIDLIVSSVDSESWRVNRTGEGEIKFFPPGMLVISQTHRVQEQVQALLDDLRRNKSEVETSSAERRAAMANEPIRRSIALDPQAAASEGAPKSIREALIKSVDWSPADAEISDDEKLLMVLDNRVLVRHLPRVVAQVEQAVRDFQLSRTGMTRSPGRGGRGMDGRGGGMF